MIERMYDPHHVLGWSVYWRKAARGDLSTRKTMRSEQQCPCTLTPSVAHRTGVCAVGTQMTCMHMY